MNTKRERGRRRVRSGRGGAGIGWRKKGEGRRGRRERRKEREERGERGEGVNIYANEVRNKADNRTYTSLSCRCATSPPKFTVT